METAVTVTGHLNGPTTIELDQPIRGLPDRVEVTVRPITTAPQEPEGLADFLLRLPPGTKTKAELDRRIQEERDAWGDR
jgi:hypothetical protein